MSYKDEYEVARLHMESGFLDELRENFEGDYKVNYHLSPPLLAREMDARGPSAQAPIRTLDPDADALARQAQTPAGNLARHFRLDP